MSNSRANGGGRARTASYLRRARAVPGIPAAVTERGDFLARDEVLRLLRIKPQTLYAYVSRGRIRRVQRPGGRASFYNREDVESLRAQSIARMG